MNTKFNKLHFKTNKLIIYNELLKIKKSNY